ncbi:arylalkylamine N-acetyltransferase 1 isoform X5 [Wyeomyia smithii]|uniref:arylalkylamine N-acetyltransferase 1 isoform X5 n=1 Tax=Wyeomyia smithii TaxID=174621 RepID=UPI002467C5EE|nr:arylalkylamine N-acetyltransferase 1 isoform X5 [Wyeomyia smithii]
MDDETCLTLDGNDWLLHPSQRGGFYSKHQVPQEGAAVPHNQKPLLKRKIMLDSKLDNIHLETITEKHYNDVIDHLRQNFFADEPLNKAVNLTRPGQGHLLLEQHSLSTLKDNTSVMAISQHGEIAGVALNGILRGYDDIKHSMEKLNDTEDTKFKKIFKLLYEQNLRVNLFSQFEVDRIFEIRILSVDSKFRGQGLAKRLIMKSEALAIEKNFQINDARPVPPFRCEEIEKNRWPESGRAGNRHLSFISKRTVYRTRR